MVMTLVGCKYSKSYADKINKAYEKGEPYTVEQVEKKMGEPTDDSKVIKTWIKGYTEDEFEKLMELSGDELKTKEFKVMSVCFINDKAVSAIYVSGTYEEIGEEVAEWTKELLEKFYEELDDLLY